MQILLVDHLPVAQFHGLKGSFRSELELVVAHNKCKLSHSQLLVANHTTIIAQVELLVKSGDRDSRDGSMYHVAHERYHRCRFSNTQESNLENVEYYCGNF
jgi:hypothetical protein